MEETAAGAATAIARNAGLGSAAGAHCVEGANHGRLERDAYRIEKLVFQSLPGLYVTGNFYVPKSATKPLPTILYLCGHSPHPLGAKFQYQDRAIWFASHGFVCLVLDTLEFARWRAFIMARTT